MAGRRTRRTQAVVLGRTKLGEQDLILRLLERDGCQTDAIAKGGRKPGSKVAARCELFCESDLVLAQGRGLPVVAESAIVNAHAGLRGAYERTACASACCEIARLTSFAEIGDDFAHPLLSRTLTACEQAEDVQVGLDLVLAAYAFKALAHGGWRPELEACVMCGEPDPRGFSATAGGAMCESCATEVAGVEAVGEVELRWIAYLLGSTFDDILMAPCDRQVAEWLAGAAHAWCATHLDARLKAFEFYLGI